VPKEDPPDLVAVDVMAYGMIANAHRVLPGRLDASDHMALVVLFEQPGNGCLIEPTVWHIDPDSDRHGNPIHQDARALVVPLHVCILLFGANKY
jgi:hypothetical protein